MLINKKKTFIFAKQVSVFYQRESQNIFKNAF